MTQETDSSNTNLSAEIVNKNNGVANPADLPADDTEVAALTVLPSPSRSRDKTEESNHFSHFHPSIVIIATILLMVIGLIFNNFWLGIIGSISTLVICSLILWPELIGIINTLIPPAQRMRVLGIIGIFISVLSLFKFVGVYQNIANWYSKINWESFGSLAEWFGALGQIFIAILAVYIAWQQYVISRDLTIEQNRLTTQQNLLTQQQTIDAYFQGISDLALDDEGLLEDWPQERAFSEGRTAAILSSVDAAGKAKVLRFLSQSRLLTPLKRDRHLGRPILNGDGGYEEDRNQGVRVIDLGIMLAGAYLANTDLRWTELSDANLIRAILKNADLVKANLSRTILYEADLSGADLKGTRFFYGSPETASPRSRTELPNYETGLNTGAVIENANFTNVKRLSDEQRYYCCAWCGEKSRATIPGGCEGIPNKLGR